jgi:serine protease Do
MGRKLFPWVLACAGIGLSFLGASASEAPRDAKKRSTWVVVSDHAARSGRAWLGVSVEEETERAQGGARVLAVVPGSPAEGTGLREGDVIVSVDGKSIYGPQGLTRALGSHEPGQSVEIGIVRDGDSQALTVDLGERPATTHFFHPFEDLEWDHEELGQHLEDAGRELERLRIEAPSGWAGAYRLGHRPRLGVRLVEVTPELREHLGGQPDAGVLVSQVMKGMPAEMAGIRVGDLIEAVDGQSIEDVGDLVEAIEGSEGGVLRIDIVRDKREQTVEVVLPDPSEHDESGGPRA